jgi:hypothetical protein
LLARVLKQANSERTAFRAPVPQLGRNDDAGADVILAHLGNPLRSFALRIPDQVGNDVPVKHVTGLNAFSGAGTGSSISGKSSSVANYCQRVRRQLVTVASVR